jgi:hypothetical protein
MKIVVIKNGISKTSYCSLLAVECAVSRGMEDCDRRRSRKFK